MPVFSYSNSLPSWQKSEKPNEKNAKLMDGQTDRQTDNSDFIGCSIGWGSNK